MEVNVMYIENVGVPNVSTMAAGAKTINTAPVRSAKASASENMIAVETKEGEVQKSDKSGSDLTKAAVNYDTSSDKRAVLDEDQQADNEKIRKNIESIKAQLSHSEVKFGIHEKTNRVTIKIVDKDTEKVIKEIPPEKTLDMIAKCMEIAGLLVDERL